MRSHPLTRLLRAAFRRKPKGPLHAARPSLAFEEIEPRILHSADLAPMMLADSLPVQVQMRMVDSTPQNATHAVSEEHAVRHELAFVDVSTPAYQQLVDDMRSQADETRELEVIFIDPHEDGIRAIGDALAGRHEVDAVHVISHGRDGAIQLGSDVLDVRALEERSTEIAHWRDALGGEADLLIYGCDVAGSAEGRLLLQSLAQLTGADVAGSDDLTGNLALGGDWNLEYRVGSIETDVAVSAMTQSTWQGTLANTAPVLSGANDLASINEDATPNPGTLVSTLIAGNIADPDGGALSGIAVTGVDNSNGAWEYSVNGGTSWIGFGAPTAASARLLAADANTYVRFVPNGGWNGTASNGLTFRAWDQTSGIAGGTADTTTATLTVRDNFSSASYSNNDGSSTWSAGWVDSDANPNSGNIRITGGELVLSTLLGTDSIYREMDLSGAMSATLSYAYNSNLVGVLGINLGTATVEISSNGGASYSTLATYSNSSGSGTFSADVSPYLGTNTRVRLSMNGLLLGGSFAVDNFQISYVTPLNGGATAFSSAIQSSSITIASVNDAPAGSDKTVVTPEDTAYTLAAIDFGFTDAGDTPANTLLAVRVTTLPGAGTLNLSGVAVTAGQTVSVAEINAGNLKFTPAADANGSGYASFTFQVQDDGGTANGGFDLDAAARTLTIDVTAVNDAPVGTSSTVQTNEDTAFVFSTADFGFSDPGDAVANSLLAVKIASLPIAGTLTLSGAAVGVGQFVSAADIAAGNLVFMPAANANGAGYASFTFQVQDDGGGTDLDTVARTLTIDVTGVNDAPIGTNKTITAIEDTPFVFGAAEFGFTDPSDAPVNALSAIRIASLPMGGTLTLSGAAVSAGDFVSVADVAAGNLVFTAAANANGASYASFTFHVQDDGGTANGGADLDSSARTLTINVTAVNDTPVGTSNTVTAVEDSPFVFTAAAFGFTDPADIPANNLAAVRIATLPTAGTLTLNGSAVAAGDVINVGEIASGKLVFAPAADANGPAYASFTFQVQDDGGGTNLDTVARTLTIDVTPVNDAPVGTGRTVVMAEDTPFVFGAADFGITDPSDAPANALFAIRIFSLPTAGTLTLSGGGVSAGDFVNVADLAAGNLVFTPTANANGAGYASFTFQVQDDGGTANGGSDLDAAARTLTIDVTAINDAPVGTTSTVQTNEDTAFVFSTADFGFTDPGDAVANNLFAVKIASVPAAGTLTLSGAAVGVGQFVSAADIGAGNLMFTPAANANGAGYASFTFQVQDDGGGTDLDMIARTLTIDVTAVNDAPSGADNTVVTLEDTSYTFVAADFGFTDPNDSSPNALASVTIGTLPGAGDLRLSGLSISAGQIVLVADIAAGNLTFSPALDANGAAYTSFTFHVQDDGGTANGGVDSSTSAKRITIDVTAVNDAPVGASGTVLTAEDTPLVFTASDFGFSDPNDVSANNLLAVRIASIPAAGSLTLSGAAVSAGQFVSVADLNAGNLTFTPAPNANGAGYASFTFQVQDDGGGADLDAIARTITIDVIAVNDAPSLLMNAGVTVDEGNAVTITSALLQAADVDNAAAQLVFTLNAVPAHGRLEFTSAPGIAATTFLQDDLDANRVVYVHDGSETTSDAFSFTVSDGLGGTTASTAVSITINSVNDAPTVMAPSAQSVLSAGELVLSAALGNPLSVGDSDAAANPVQVTVSASKGAVTLARTTGLTLVAGTGMRDAAVTVLGSVADINAAFNGLIYTADGNYSGHVTLTVTVNDLGSSGTGTAQVATATVDVDVKIALTASAVDGPPVPPPNEGTPLPALPANLSASNQPSAAPAAASDSTDLASASVADSEIEAASDAAGLTTSVVSNPVGAGSFFGTSERLIDFQQSSREYRLVMDVLSPAQSLAWVQPGSEQGAVVLASTEVTRAEFLSLDAGLNDAFTAALDEMRASLREASRLDAHALTTAAAATLGLSVGYVIWLLRGGVLLSSLLSSLPAWRLVDPLPILGRLDDDDEDDSDDSLESIVARTNSTPLRSTAERARSATAVTESL